MKPLARTLIAIALIGATAGASAVSWVKQLQYTPAEVFEDEDLQMFLDSAKATLNATGEPQLVKWNNPATGAGGSFQVTALLKSKSGAPCKKLHMTVYAKARSEKGSTLTLCQTADQRWKIISTANK
jgi:hypothetical protein